MKLAEYDGQVQTSGDLQPTRYKIATNRKSFEVLSKSLYSDRVRAVIRELSTNAADAHIAAELTNAAWKKQPFVVHLPNGMEPFFSVQDYGTGMSHEEIDELYTTYFASNRNTSNRFTGALGLGSKSPFTYSDTFTVISVFNGQKRTYTCIVNSHGEPEVNPMPIGTNENGNAIYVEKTDEPNGVTVKVPVEKKDFVEFEQKAHDVLRWFEPRPEVVGSANFKFADTKYLFKTELFGMSTDRRDQSHIIMGNVAYSLGAYDLQGLAGHETALIQWGVDLWVEIGEVDIAANREKLSYTPETTKLIKSKLKKVAEHMRVEATKFLERANTIWEARRMIHDYKKGVMGGFLENAKLTWKGQPLTALVYLDKFFKPPLSCELVYRGRVHRGSNYPSLRKNPTNHVEADGSPIFIDDLPRGGIKKIAYHMQSKNFDKAYILSDTRKLPDLKKADLVNDDDDDEVKNLPPIEDSGLYETAVKASTLPDVPKIPRVYDGAERNHYTRLMRFKSDSTSHDYSTYWANEKVDVNDGGIYLVMNRFGVIKGGKKDLPKEIRGYDRDFRNPQSCISPVNCLDVLGEEIVVFGVRPSDVERLKKAGNWQTLKDYVQDYMKEHADDYMPRVTKSLQFAAVEGCRGFLKLKRDEFSDDSPFGKFIDSLYEAKKENENKEVKAYIELCAWAGKEANTQVKKRDSDKLANAHDKLRDIYPLLNLVVPSSIDGKTAGNLTEYIQLVDQNRVSQNAPVPEIFDAEEVTA